MHYLYLCIAILSEVIATSSLKASHEFTRLWPSVAVVAGYMFSFYFLTLSLRNISLGIAYAIWSGFGIILVAAAGYFFYHQKLDTAAVGGIALIIAGVMVINVFSKTSFH